MPQLFRNLNGLGLLMLNVILIFAFYDQFMYQELPCPLCLLQRVGLVAVMFGLLMNIQYGPKPLHYGLMLISALYGAIVALRQISLHVIPGTPGYGDPFMGWHYYTWAFIVFFLILLGSSVILMFPGQYEGTTDTVHAKKPLWCKIIITISLVMVATNAVSAFLECGVGACPDNPKKYETIEALD